MRGVWAFAAVVCGVVALGALGLILRQARSPFGFRNIFGILFGLAVLYAAWRAARRALRPSSAIPATPSSETEEVGLSPRRLVASLVAAIIVMSVSLAVGFYVAASGEWGGEDGILYWTVMLFGHGLRIAGVWLRPLGLSAIGDLAQCAVLVAIFYLLGTWWAKRRAGVLKALRRRLSTVTQRRARAALTTVGAVLALGTISATAMHFVLRGRNLVSAYEGSKGVESFQIGSGRREVLWRIEAPPGQVLERLQYGEVPEGFRQTVPEAGRPRPLSKGESLVTQILTPERYYQHFGRAVGAGRFVSGIRVSAPRRLRRGLSPDQMRRAIEESFPSGRISGVREVMKDEGFACREVKDGVWNDRSHDFLECRRGDVGPEGERILEVAFFLRDAKVDEILIRELRKERSAK